MSEIPFAIGAARPEVETLGLPGRADRPAADPAASASQLATEFEALLLLQMVRQMRQPLFGEREEGLGADTLLDTIDLELARHLSQQGGLGLARVLAGAITPPDRGDRDRDARGQVGIAPSASPSAAPRPAPETRPDAVSSERSTPPAGLRDAHVTSLFGWRQDPLSGEMRFHAGLDIKAAYGADVKSAARGRVVFAGPRGSYGNLVVVEHADGDQTRYAHLSAILVRADDQVGEGQLIGRAGATGRAAGPHLHFVVVRGGRRVDPSTATWVAQAAQAPDSRADSPVEGI